MNVKAMAARVTAVGSTVLMALGTALARAQEATPTAPEGSTGLEFSPWSAILVIVTLVIVFGGIVIYLAVERHRA